LRHRRGPRLSPSRAGSLLAVALADRQRFALWPLLCWATIPLAARLQRLVAGHADGATLNRALAGTGQLQLAFCALLSAGLLMGH
jgi:1,4-dihydroxy-2-naphthoate octaprenyltransferase